MVQSAFQQSCCHEGRRHHCSVAASSKCLCQHRGMHATLFAIVSVQNVHNVPMIPAALKKKTQLLSQLESPSFSEGSSP